MDIKKLDNISGSNINKTSKGGASRDASSKSSAGTPTDKVSLGDYQFRKNDQLFAKLELEKLNDSSSERFNDIKKQVSEFAEASQDPNTDAQETDMGQKINDPSVLNDIANKILQ